MGGVAVGYDFRFGKGRRGDFAMLRHFSAELGFKVFQIAAAKIPDTDTPYSSSAIRQFLRDGDPRRAAELLGRYWAIEAEVQEGDKRGRTIGFATANMPLIDYVEPRFGVYAVRTYILSGKYAGEAHEGVANLGLRPTVGGEKPRLETHLFDFDKDIYGAELSVELVAFLRPEQKFDGLDALKNQIAQDAEKARAIFAKAQADW